MKKTITLQEIIDNIILKEYIDVGNDETFSVKSPKVQEYYNMAIKLIDACIGVEDNELMESIDNLGYKQMDILIILGFMAMGIFDFFKNEEELIHFNDIIQLYMTSSAMNNK